MASSDLGIHIVLNGVDKFKSDTQNALGTITKSGGNTVKVLKGMGKVALATTTAIVGAFVAVSKNGVQVAADLESARQGFVTLLGSAKKADDAISMIVRDAAKTPFEIPGLIRANQMLTQVTGNAARSESVLLNIGKALAAAGKGSEELDRVIINLQQIANTGKITELDIRQFGYAGINILSLLADYYGVTKDKASDMLKSSKNAFKDLEGAFAKAGMAGGQFANAFTNQAGTMNQLGSNLRDSWNIFTADFVKSTGIFDIVKQAVGKFTETLSWIQTVLPSIINQGKSTWASFIDAFTNSTFFEYIKVQFGLFKAMWDGIVSGFSMAWQVIKPILTELGKSLSTMFGTASTEGNKFKVSFQTIGKAIGIIVGGIAIGIVGIVTAIVKVNNALLWLIGKVQGVRLSITSAFQSIATSMVKAYNAIPLLPDLPMPKFAQGGIVGGSSTSGDKVMARVNSGEMILTKGQQGALFSMLKNMSSGNNINFNGGVNFTSNSSPMQQQNNFVNMLQMLQ